MSCGIAHDADVAQRFNFALRGYLTNDIDQAACQIGPDSINAFAPPQATDEYYSRMSSPVLSMPRHSSLSFLSPIDCIDNQGQRFLLCRALQTLLAYAQWELNCALDPRANLRSPPEQLLGKVVGEAGTGKTFVMQVLSACNRALAVVDHADLRLAPTGAAAGACQGSTVDRVLKIKRTANTIDTLEDFELTRLCSTLESSRLVCLDEKSMWGRKLLGHAHERLNELSTTSTFNNTTTTSSPTVDFGRRPVVLMFGDFMQLPPLLDQPLYDIGQQDMKNSKTPATMSGELAFRTLQNSRCASAKATHSPNKCANYVHPRPLTTLAPSFGGAASCASCPETRAPPSKICGAHIPSSA